jgi:hypothetical protein
MIRDICRSIWANQYLKENQEIWNQLLKKDATAGVVQLVVDMIPVQAYQNAVI